MPEIVLFAVRIGFLVLLWLFVLSAVRVVRNDLFGARAAGEAPPQPPRAAAVPRRGRGDRGSPRSTARKLVVTAGSLTWTSLTLGEAPVTIGRADDSTLVLTDDYISSRHARLGPGEGAWLVEDLGSTNGTYLDRTRVTGPTPVPIGAPIRIGKTVLELRR